MLKNAEAAALMQDARAMQAAGVLQLDAGRLARRRGKGLAGRPQRLQSPAAGSQRRRQPTHSQHQRRNWPTNAAASGRTSTPSLLW